MNFRANINHPKGLAPKNDKPKFFIFQFPTALQALMKTALSGPPKGGFGKSVSSSITGSVTTTEGGGNKDSSIDGSSSK